MTVVNKKKVFLREAKDYIVLYISAVIAAYALEGVLIPNNIMDGGVTGISIIVSELTGISIAILIFLLNMPFVLLSLKKVGKVFAIKTTFGVASLSIMLTQFHHIDVLFEDTILAVVFGGVLLGAAIGLAMRANGTLDGTEALAIVLNEKIPFNVDDIILGINFFIFAAATFVFDIEKAAYSLITYFIAATAINIVLKGFATQKKISIISDKADEIASTLLKEMNITSTIYTGVGTVSKDKKTKVEIVINRLEEMKVETLIKDIDSKCFYSVVDISHVYGGRFKSKSH